MKKLLILIVSLAVFLHFYPQPELKSWVIERKNAIETAFSDATDTQIKLKADKIFTDLASELEQFGPSEVKYLKTITASRQQVVSFYEQYCKKNRPSPKLHAQNQAKICRTIDKYQSLL